VVRVPHDSAVERRTTPVTLNGVELAAWLEGQLPEVEAQLDQTLNVLEARKAR